MRALQEAKDPSPQTRNEIYNRAHRAIIAKLKSIDPPVAEAMSSERRRSFAKRLPNRKGNSGCRAEDGKRPRSRHNSQSSAARHNRGRPAHPVLPRRTMLRRQPPAMEPPRHRLRISGAGGHRNGRASKRGKRRPATQTAAAPGKTQDRRRGIQGIPALPRWKFWRRRLRRCAYACSAPFVCLSS